MNGREVSWFTGNTAVLGWVVDPMKIPTGCLLARAVSLCLSRSVALLIALCLGCGLSSDAVAQDYLVSNDDSFTNGVSFYTIGPDGGLTFQQEVAGPGLGIDGGLFGMMRLAIVNSGNTQCIFASEAFTNDVAWIVAGGRDLSQVTRK